LANNGILFKRAISPSPWIIPTIASILTSLYPSAHQSGKILWEKEEKKFKKIGESIPMLQEILHTEAYLTQAIISNPFLAKEHGFAKGFDEYYHFEESILEKEVIFCFRLINKIKNKLLSRMGDLQIRSY